MKGKIKIALAGIIMAVSSTVFAQCDDSTCVGNVPLHNQPLQNTYAQQLVFNYTPTTVSYNYMTSACPAGYRGANGQTGYIIDRQTVLTYSNGTVHVSDWVEYEDNCEEIPPPVTPPAPTSVNFVMNRVCYVFIMTGLEAPTCFARAGSYNTTIAGFNATTFQRWALGYSGSICPYPYAASNISIVLSDLNSTYVATYASNSWFPPYTPIASVYDAAVSPDKGLLSIQINCSGF